MNTAEKLTCSFPEIDDVQVICETTAPFDWIALGSMVGTLLAVLASVATAIYAVRHSNESREKALELERKKRFNDSFFSFSETLMHLRDSLPDIDHSRALALSESVQKMSIDMLTGTERKLHSSIAELAEKIMSGYLSEWFSTLPIRFRPGSPGHGTRRPEAIQGASTVYQVILGSSAMVKNYAYLILAAKDEQSELIAVEQFAVECKKFCQKLIDQYENDDEY
ncbi:MAG TPA: hypothetical protein DIT09_10095 [Glutamicibacter sp.]|nr:hypothetical protein [Glutamicibacter sp.]